MSAKRVTLRQLAEETGFTVNTVSRALKDQKVISAQTREIIQQKARELGYIPNRAAANLRSGKTGTVYFVCGSMTDPMNAAMFEAVREAAGETDVLPIPGNGTAEGDYAALRTACSLSGDGILYASRMNDDVTRLLKNSAVPTVLLMNRDTEGAYSCAVMNETEAGAAAARYLLDAGRRSFVFACDEDSAVSNGFFAALSDAGVDGNDRRVVRPSDENAIDEIVNFVNEKGQIGLAGDSLLCRGLMSALMQRGIWIPGGALLCGIGNVDDVVASPMPITQVDCDRAAMAAWAVEKLAAMIADPETAVEANVFAPACIVR